MIKHIIILISLYQFYIRCIYSVVSMFALIILPNYIHHYLLYKKLKGFYVINAVFCYFMLLTRVSILFSILVIEYYLQKCTRKIAEKSVNTNNLVSYFEHCAPYKYPNIYICRYRYNNYVIQNLK